MTSSPVYNVLIVEDEYPARMLMTEYIINCPELKLSGIAENGEKAIAMLTEKSYDLVFIDINLPAVSGMEIFKRFSNSKTSLSLQLLTVNMQWKHLSWMLWTIY